MGEGDDGVQRYARGAVLRGKYRVERVLGEGGMGVVLLATHLKLDQRVAIKMLAPAVEKRANVQARFAREARAAAKLRNEHIVRVIDVDETEDGVPFLVMEYLVGSDLDAILSRDGPLSPARAADYVLQACEGIAEAHAVGFVHRDLKPANLFLAKNDDGGVVVKVLDFGIAKAVEGDDDLSLTATSGVVGSPLYMSPEQLKGSKDVDPRTDVWSLGVVLYQLVTGKLPFQATSATALAALIASEPHVPLGDVRDDVPPAYVEAVHRCLRKAPAERFASVVELARALAELAPGAEGAADRVSRVSRAAMTKRLSLAETQPSDEEDAPGENAAAAPASSAPPRITAELSSDAAAAEPSAPPGQRTDYGSEVARKPSAPPPPKSRRAALALASIALSGIAALAAVRSFSGEPRANDAANATREAAAGSAPAAAIAAPSIDAGAPAVPSAPASLTAPVASAFAPIATAASSAPREPRRGSAPHVPAAASASAKPAVPATSANPLDIDLK